MPVKNTALITGASSGLGIHFAKILGAKGYDLVLTARNVNALETLAKELRTAHRKITVTVIPADLSKPGAPAKLAHELTKKNISISMLVNNAGFGGYGHFAKSDWEHEAAMLQVNVAALTALTKLLLPSMIKRKRGRILNVASTAAFQPGPLMAVYYATKAYVLSFSLALSNETKGTGVTVTCLCPGPTRTNFAHGAKMDKSPLFRGVVMNAEPVARAGIDGCFRGKHLVTPGLFNKVGTFCTRLIPRSFAASIARRVQETKTS